MFATAQSDCLHFIQKLKNQKRKSYRKEKYTAMSDKEIQSPHLGISTRGCGNQRNEEITYPPVLLEFAAHKTGIQNCSSKTVDEYLLDLRTFLRYIIATRNGIDIESDDFMQIDISGVDAAFLGSITDKEIRLFIGYTGNVRRNMWSARARKLSAIKALYRYLTVTEHYFKDDPAKNIEAPKPKKTLPKYLSLEESIQLLDAVKNDKESKSRTRDYAIITLFLNCGMRVSELAGIGINDIDTSGLRSVRVLGKGNKERIIYLNEACREALLEYLRERFDKNHARLNTKALFLSNRGQRMSVKTIQWMVYKYLDMAGLESKHYSVHKLRHTAATLMYQTGQVDVRVLKEILGHAQLNTTQIYTHVSDSAIERAMTFNPLSGEHSENAQSGNSENSGKRENADRHDDQDGEGQ